MAYDSGQQIGVSMINKISYPQYNRRRMREIENEDVIIRASDLKHLRDMEVASTMLYNAIMESGRHHGFFVHVR